MSVVQTVDEYLDACRRIRTNGRALFRGQSRDYGAILPSLFRGKVERPADAHDLIVELYMEVHGLHWKRLKEERQRELEESYGVPVGAFPSGDWSGRWSELETLLDPDFVIAGGPGVNYTRDDFLAELM